MMTYFQNKSKRQLKRKNLWINKGLPGLKIPVIVVRFMTANLQVMWRFYFFCHFQRNSERRTGNTLPYWYTSIFDRIQSVWKFCEILS